MINARTASIVARTSGFDSLRIKGWQLLVRFMRHATPKKLANLASANLDFKLTRVIPRSYPYHYVIDPLNSCNLRCPLCPTGRRTLKRKHGRMDAGVFTTIVDQMREYAFFLDLYNWGESILHKDISYFISYASERNISVKMSANLNFLRDGQEVELVRSGLDELVISIDGATQESYASYRRGGHLSTVLSNLRKVLLAREEIGSRLPFVNVRVLLNKHNEGEIGDLKRACMNLGVDNVLVAPMLIDTSRRGDLEEWAPTDSRGSYYEYERGQDKTMSKGSACPYLWRSMVVNWEGSVSPCCWLDDPNKDFGDFCSSSLASVWRGSAYTNARRVFSRELPELETACQICKGAPKHMY